MNRMTKGLALAGLLSVGLFTQAAYRGEDPEAALKSLNEWYSNTIRAQSGEGKQLDIRALLSERTAKAKEAVAGLNLETTDPKQCLALAQLYTAAGDTQKSILAAKRFLTSNPEPAPKFSAQSMVLGGLNTAGDAQGILKLLGEIVPPSKSATCSLAMSIANMYSRTVHDKLGEKAVLELLAKADGMIPAEVDTKEKSIRESAIVAVGTRRAEVFMKAGKKDDAAKAYAETKAKLPADSRMIASIDSKLNLAKLPGSMASALIAERSIGEFRGLESLRGKVVVLDFTAHWCPPCKASIPSMKKMHDQLKDKGLEIVSVTRMYGYYEKEKNLSSDQEFEKLKGFVKEHEKTWPMIVGGNENFTAYGVSGIPQYVVIDQAGKVNHIVVGFNEPLHAELRGAVEKLLNNAAKTSNK